MPGEIDVAEQNAAQESSPVQNAAQESSPVQNAAQESSPVQDAAQESSPVQDAHDGAQESQESSPVQNSVEESSPVQNAAEEIPSELNELKAEVKEVPPESIIQQNGTPKKVPMSTTLDGETVRAAIDDVRSDSTKTQWAVFKFEGRSIVCSATGAEFEKFKEQFTENERAFGYIRIQTGDEMSKRQKFLFVTWVGPSVSVLQRAKMSTDKSVIKNVISNFAVELQLENTSEIDLGHFVDELNKAGGANYGTGIREI